MLALAAQVRLLSVSGGLVQEVGEPPFRFFSYLFVYQNQLVHGMSPGLVSCYCCYCCWEREREKLSPADYVQMQER